MSQTDILITGANGFVGRRLVKRLSVENRRLRLVVRSSNNCPEYWKTRNLLHIAAQDDLANIERNQKLIKGVSTIVHLAGLAHRPNASEEDFLKSNTELTACLARAAERSDVHAFINLSSIAATIGNPPPERLDQHLSDKVIEPASAYGRSKSAAEKYVRALAAGGMFAVSLRPPLVIGAEAKGNWRKLQLLAASGLPLPFAAVHNRRSFCSIETLTEAIAQLCLNRWKSEKSGEYFVADDEIISIETVLVSLRAGMRIPKRLFAIPQPILKAAERLPILGSRVGMLTQNLTIDATDFYTGFNFMPNQPLRGAIRRSGAEFLAKRKMTHPP